MGCEMSKKEGASILKMTFLSLLLCLIGMIFFENILYVSAEENQELKQGTLVDVLQDIEMREKPDDTSKVLFSFHAGDQVFQTGDAENGWCPVMYQMVNGYIHSEGILPVGGEQAISSGTGNEQTDQTEQKVQQTTQDSVIKVYADKKTAEEMEVTNEQLNNFGSEVELDRAHQKRSRIWGAIIVIVILLFIGSGVWPSIQEARKKKKTAPSEDELLEIDLTKDETVEQ